MQFKYTIEQASQLIKLARQSIKEEFESGKEKENREKQGLEKKEFRQARGVFVTLLTFPEKKLRGCIGFPYPSLPINEAVSQAAKSSAFSDPRFPAMKKEEINKIIIEFSILTIPQEIKDVKNIEIGKHGLMCQYLGYSGLLLPQVAIEHNMNKLKFIEAVCQKAGLPRDTWQDDKCKFHCFQTQIFTEIEPNGGVMEK